MKVGWIRPAAPLDPVAVAAQGSVGTALAERSGLNPNLTIDAAAEWTVVRGPDLPWVDGVTYLGVLAGLSSLLVPVHLIPAVPPDVLLSAVRRLAEPDRGPFALLPGESGVDVVVLSS